MVSTHEPAPLLAACGIHKHFLAVHALKNVSAAFHAGEVVAVVGENGAGKSTLMKVLAGVHTPDEGEILLEDKKVTIDDVNRATELGIAFIHQELNLADNLSVGANIFLGREPRRLGPAGFVNKRAIRDRTREILNQLGLPIDPDVIVRDLTIGHQQMVEIAKALSQNARVLIMDEPTSSLTQHETDRLFAIVRDLKAQGMCIVFISHRLAEVDAIADRVIVLRDGKNSGELQRDEIDHDRIVSLMVGRKLDLHQIPGGVEAGDVLLEVRDLRVARFRETPVSFQLRAGEIVGMAGLVGAGRTDLVRALFGIDHKLSGTVLVGGKEVVIRTPHQAIDAGLALVPEDRKQQGVIVEMAIGANVVMAGLERYQRARFVSNRRLDEVARSMIERLRIKTPSVDTEVSLLSGGNQQKVVLAKWISLQPKVLLLDEPTRGIDVGSKSEIYEVIKEMAASGVAVLFISSELEEVLRVSDRVLVMHEGALAGALEGDAATEEAVMQMATGSR